MSSTGMSIYKYMSLRVFTGIWYWYWYEYAGKVMVVTLPPAVAHPSGDRPSGGGEVGGGWGGAH